MQRISLAMGLVTGAPALLAVLLAGACSPQSRTFVGGSGAAPASTASTGGSSTAAEGGGGAASTGGGSTAAEGGGGAASTGGGATSAEGGGGAASTGGGATSAEGGGGAASTGGGSTAAEGGGGSTAAGGGDDCAGLRPVRPSPPEIIAKGLADPYSIAVDSRNVFILTSTELLRCPVTGCEKPMLLAEGLSPLSVSPYLSYRVAVDDLYVHWVGDAGRHSGAYFRCPAAGCFSAVPELMGENVSSGFRQIQAGDGGVVRILDKFDVYECSGEKCVRSCANGDGLQSFVMDETTLYWAHTTDPGGVYFCKAGDPTSQVQLHNRPGAAMAIQDGIHYVMSQNTGSIFSCKKTGCGGSPDPFVTGQQKMTSMAVGCSGVYWTTEGSGTAADGMVQMCPLSGCRDRPRVIASGQARPTSIHIQGGFVYWANRGIDLTKLSGEIVRAGL